MAYMVSDDIDSALTTIDSDECTHVQNSQLYTLA
jgi:hypothetical protein